jgi:hypothetical protein
MGKSFFLGTYAEVYTGSAAFSTQITATPTAFGLVAAQATAYAALNDAYATAYLAAQDPSTRTKGQTAAKKTAKQNLIVMASNLAKIIQGTPTVTDQQKIDLGISVRATPTPIGPLGKAEDFKVSLDPASGTVKLTWKCKNPRGASGTCYQVYRRLGAVGEFQYMGGVGEKKYTDSAVPSGTAQVQYQIQAVRSTSMGPWALCIVNFGNGDSASITEGKPVKIAA